MFRIILFICTFVPIFIYPQYCIDCIDSILGSSNFSYIDSINDNELRISVHEYMCDQSKNEMQLLQLLIPYRIYLEDEAQQAYEDFPSLYSKLNKAGYTLISAEKLAYEGDIGALMNNYPHSDETEKQVLKGIDDEFMQDLYQYACRYSSSQLLNKLFAEYNDSFFIILNGFKQRDSISTALFVIQYPELIEYCDSDTRIYSGHFIPDSTDIKKNAYYRGRYYESNSQYIKAMHMYAKADDSEAYIRMIACAGNEWGRNISDSLLLNDKTEYLPVLYHKAKVLYTKGRRDEADLILDYLASMDDINYYSVRAMLIRNRNIHIMQQKQAQNAEHYLILYETLKKYDAQSILTNLAYKKYSKNNEYAAFFAVLFNELDMYHISILYGYRMLRGQSGLKNAASYLYPQPHMDIFKKAAEQYNMDIALLYAIARQESWFNAEAKSPVGAMGIMQLMDFVYDEYYDDRDYFNIEKNIDAGARHISNYLALFPENPAYGIMAYNAGPGNVAKWERNNIDWELYLEMIPYRETRIFVKNIMRDYFFYSLIVSES